MTPRRWIMLGLAVALFCLLSYHRIMRNPQDKIHAVPDSAVQAHLQRPVPAFSFMEAHGETVTRESLLGRPWIAYFFFTTCPSICPIMNQNAAALRDALPENTQVKIVGFTVDPEKDTPEVLQRYGTRFSVQPEQWLMLHGGRQEMFDLSTKGFLLPAMEADAEQAPEMGPVVHSPKMVLVGPDGNIVQYFDGLAEDFPQQVMGTLRARQWLP